MRELSKSIPRRLNDPNFLRRYFVGDGVDIGGRPDPLALYTELFPLLEDVRVWDLEDGDAELMDGVDDNTFDFVSSSHCLEHLNDPLVGLSNWLRVTRPNGYVVILVPDEDLYEQGQFPSTWNHDHKWTFTIYKKTSWSEKSVNVLDLVANLGPEARLEKVEQLNATYRYDLPRYDQTATPIGEAAIEIIIRKAPPAEAESGALVRSDAQPTSFLRRYYNQYRDDYQQMKSNNTGAPPFENTNPL